MPYKITESHIAALHCLPSNAPTCPSSTPHLANACAVYMLTPAPRILHRKISSDIQTLFAVIGWKPKPQTTIHHPLAWLIAKAAPHRLLFPPRSALHPQPLH
ncbi:hypothetical protein ACN47E_000074 [Coniothyrium glycines]